jgi:hypothetical protein
MLLQKFGVKEQEVHNALLSGDPHDQLAIAYHLIIDNKRIADEAAKAELKDFYVASSPPPMSFSPSELNPSPIRPHPERIARKFCDLWYSAVEIRENSNRKEFYLYIFCSEKSAELRNSSSSFKFCPQISCVLSSWYSSYDTLRVLSHCPFIPPKMFSCHYVLCIRIQCAIMFLRPENVIQKIQFYSPLIF